MLRFFKAVFAKPFAFKFHGKIIDNDRVEVDDLELGIFWLILFIFLIIKAAFI